MQIKKNGKKKVSTSREKRVLIRVDTETVILMNVDEDFIEYLNNFR